MTRRFLQRWIASIRWYQAAVLGAVVLANPTMADQRLVQQPSLPQEAFPGSVEDEMPTEPLAPQETGDVPPPIPQPDSAPLDDSEFQRDPVVPSPEILELLQPRRHEIPGATPTYRAISPLPSLPELQLKAIVLSNASSGTALLVSDQRQFSVPLGRKPLTARTDFPPRQFWQYRETLALIDEAIADDEPSGPTEQLPAPRAARAVRLDGFSIDGIFFSVEDFSDRAVLLRAYPHDVFVLVQ